MSMQDLSREIILDHYQNPRNHGRLEHPTLADRSAHAGFEEPVSIAPVGLGAIERRVGMAEEGFAIGGIVREKRDPDAGRDAVDFGPFARRLQRFQDGLGDTTSGGRKGKAGRNNGKLIAAQSRQHLAFIQHSSNTFCDGLKRLVARRVAK